MRQIKLTPQILLDAGFTKYNDFSSLDYYRYITLKEDGVNNLKLDIEYDENLNRYGTNWHLHIDNCDCETIGTADINTVWEFNTLMKVFKSNFRL